MENMPEKLVWDGFGFPIVILGARWKQTPSGYAVLDIDLTTLGEVVRDTLLLHPAPLTGKQVSFLRKHFEMTLEEFGKIVGKSHAGVKYWEDKGEAPAGMDANAELLLRLRLARMVNGEVFKRVLEEVVLPGCRVAERPIEVVAPTAA